jgi:hypothetical protein
MLWRHAASVSQSVLYMRKRFPSGDGNSTKWTVANAVPLPWLRMTNFWVLVLFALAMLLSSLRDDEVPTSCTATNTGRSSSNRCWSAGAGLVLTKSSYSCAPVWRPTSIEDSPR